MINGAGAQHSDDERGSVINEHHGRPRNGRSPEPKVVKPTSYHKKTFVPLTGVTVGPNQHKSNQNATMQIIVRHIGTQKERFGSVSFTLQRFLKATSNEFSHWVTLYEELNDDLFEGELGQDEDNDFPRILLSYQIVSSQFTSMINRAEELRKQALEAQRRQNNASTVTSKRGKATKLVNASQTVEFEERRIDKVTGNRKPFKPYVMTDQEQDRYERFRHDALAEGNEKLSKQEQEDRMRHMK